ncbi:MAG: cation transporter [Chloroflexota bacterium]|nr:MAG: cation transporter [Chloroflexota bacterium]
MQSKTFTVPNISCGHCVHTVEMEVGDLAGVKNVNADQDSKQVVVEWGEPATWEQIETLLVEINYAPAA